MGLNLADFERRLKHLIETNKQTTPTKSWDPQNFRGGKSSGNANHSRDVRTGSLNQINSNSLLSLTTSGTSVSVLSRKAESSVAKTTLAAFSKQTKAHKSQNVSRKQSAADVPESNNATIKLRARSERSLTTSSPKASTDSFSANAPSSKSSLRPPIIPRIPASSRSNADSLLAKNIKKEQKLTKKASVVDPKKTLSTCLVKAYLNRDVIAKFDPQRIVDLLGILPSGNIPSAWSPVVVSNDFESTLNVVSTNSDILPLNFAILKKRYDL